MLCCPITTEAKGSTFEVEVLTREISRVAISDQVKSLDWQARETKVAGTVKEVAIAQVRDRLKVLMFDLA